MKKILYATVLLLLFALPVVSFGATVSAADPVAACADQQLAQTSVCKEVANSAESKNVFVRAITFIIELLSYIVGIAAVIGVIVSGLRLVIANGDSSGVANARQGLVYSLIGIVIVIFAQAIVAFVLNKL